MSELKLCSYCKSVLQANTWTLHGISETRYFCPNPECPHSVRTVTLEEWQTRPIEDALQTRIAELEGIIKSDDERLTEAGLKVNLYFGCDTAEIMAEEILSSRARIAELEGELDKEKQVSNQLYLLLVDNPKDKELADSLTEAIRGTEERELKACPFCGSDSVTWQSMGEYTRTGCVDCGAEITRPMGLYKNAMIAWNTRPIEDALTARIAELETEIYQLTAHSDIERQDDKSPNDTQTQAIVYGKESEKIKKALRMAVNVGCGFEGDAEDAASLLSLIETNEARIAELEEECASLGVRLHDEMSQLEIATDLGNKRWTALNEIYEKSEKHSAWWCKRKAQEGLGIK